MDKATFIAVITVLSTLLCIFVIAFSHLYVIRHRHSGTASTSSTDPEVAAPSPSKIPLVPRNAPLDGWDEGAVKCSFAALHLAVSKYVRKWMLHRDDSAVAGDDSPCRIEDLLFNDAPGQEFLWEGRDTKLFINQRKHTPEEICSLLQNESTRDLIAHHILMSILLQAVSLDGLPQASLLPLNFIDLNGLRRLREALRGVELSPAVTTHVRSFGAYHGSSSESKWENETMYVKLIESVFQPYLKAGTFDDDIDRRSDLGDALLKAADHGMKVIGCPDYEFQYKWGERDMHTILSYPGLSATVYENGRFDRVADLIEPREDSVVRGGGV